MPWFAKRAEKAGVSGIDSLITPAPLAVTLDHDIASARLDRLQELAVSEGGLEPLIDALRTKQALFARALPDDPKAEILAASLMQLLACIFPARRKLYTCLSALDEKVLTDCTRELIHAPDVLTTRMQRFVSGVCGQGSKKEQRAAWDLAAELLHFRAPEQVPLLTRWVFDERTMSGAVREFIRLHPSVDRIELSATPEQMEAVRLWFGEFLRAKGFYRDLPLMIDLLLAQAYADYVKAMSTGIGMVEAEFAASQHPFEFISKLLGIDAQSSTEKI